jgi:hypothetical protein
MSWNHRIDLRANKKSLAAFSEADVLGWGPLDPGRVQALAKSARTFGASRVQPELLTRFAMPKSTSE